MDILSTPLLLLSTFIYVISLASAVKFISYGQTHHTAVRLPLKSLFKCLIRCAAVDTCYRATFLAKYNDISEECTISDKTAVKRYDRNILQFAFLSARNQVQLYLGHHICFGARGDTPGSFVFNSPSGIYKIKLVHKFGGVTCKPNPKVPFGCLKSAGPSASEIVIVDRISNGIIVSESEIGDYGGPVAYPLYVATNGHFKFYQGKEYNVWYSEDYHNINEHDNSGSSCADVYFTQPQY